MAPARSSTRASEKLRPCAEIPNLSLRTLIGTHSRTIEGRLFDLLHAHGWVCESELPCILRPMMEGGVYLVADGEQVWRNDWL